MRAFAILLLSVVVNGQGSPAAVQDPTALWRTARNCGANCLFLLLRSRGHIVDYSEVLAATPIGPRGSSLTELHTAAMRLGAGARIGKGAPSALATARLPVIAHLDVATGDAQATGHFVLVTDVDLDAGRLHVFDGASLLESDISMEHFRRSWSGFVVEIGGGIPTWIYIAVSAAAIGVGLALARFVPRRTRSVVA